jgi:Putative MetA-pathway of phenol degradation
MVRPLLTAALCLILTAVPARAQQPYNVAVRVDQLARIFADLYGPEGLVVDSTAALAGGQSHSGHFRGGFESEFSQFGIALTSQLVSLPYPTPAAGFTYQFDPALGVFTRTTNSFGPILSDRAETIGARRLSFGFAAQRLQFDSIEGLDLDAIPAVFTHESAELRGGREDVITTMNSVEATVTRSTAFLSYGVTNRFDISIAVPIVTADMLVTSHAKIRRLGTTLNEIHFFRMADDSVGDERIFTAFGQASGIGDVNIRGKATLKRTDRYGVAVGVDVKLPTGDEMNLLGTGSTAVQPYAVWSASLGPFSPHLNAGYRWNGTSVLGSEPGSGQARDLPDVAVYSAGGALEVHPRLTLAVDVLGRMVLDSPRLSRTTFRGLDPAETPYSDIDFRRRMLHELSAATGFKINVADRLLVTGNLLFQLNADGLRAKVSPMIGVEYAF